MLGNIQVHLFSISLKFIVVETRLRGVIEPSVYVDRFVRDDVWGIKLSKVISQRLLFKKLPKLFECRL